jgi:hypothetical protein
MRFAAVHAGVSRGREEAARDHLRAEGRVASPHQAARLGAMAPALAAWRARGQAGSAWDAGTAPAASDAARPQATTHGHAARVVAERSLLEVADLVQRPVGQRGIIAAHPLKRRLCDACLLSARSALVVGTSFRRRRSGAAGSWRRSPSAGHTRVYLGLADAGMSHSDPGSGQGDAAGDGPPGRAARRSRARSLAARSAPRPSRQRRRGDPGRARVKAISNGALPSLSAALNGQLEATRPRRAGDNARGGSS